MHIKYLINSPDEPSFSIVCVITGWRLTTLRGLLQTAQADPVVQTARGVKLVHVVTGKSLPQVTGDDLTGLVVVHAPDGLTLDPEGVLTGVRELLYLGDGLDVTWGARCVVTYIDPGVVLNARVSCKKKINNVMKSLRFVDRIFFLKGGGRGCVSGGRFLWMVILKCRNVILWKGKSFVCYSFRLFQAMDKNVRCANKFMYYSSSLYNPFISKSLQCVITWADWALINSAQKNNGKLLTIHP